MMELGVSQAQSLFTKLLNKKVTIIDKKTKKKKAVILPYSEYQALLKNQKQENLEDGSFSKFVGILDKDFKTEDTKYNEIIK